ncbi:hypothetical protein PUN28_010540 [Cardiocondyla obscurior]|uniref:Uncharacterized protein n=1 Tax=Cardiocondyla obscurior TaxID=286306 RepID=A0AAW2FIH7_9HYME
MWHSAPPSPSGRNIMRNSDRGVDAIYTCLRSDPPPQCNSSNALVLHLAQTRVSSDNVEFSSSFFFSFARITVSDILINPARTPLKKNAEGEKTREKEREKTSEQPSSLSSLELQRGRTRRRATKAQQVTIITVTITVTPSEEGNPRYPFRISPSSPRIPCYFTYRRIRSIKNNFFNRTYNEILYFTVSRFRLDLELAISRIRRATEIRDLNVRSPRLINTASHIFSLLQIRGFAKRFLRFCNLHSLPCDCLYVRIFRMIHISAMGIRVLHIKSFIPCGRRIPPNLHPVRRSFREFRKVFGRNFLTLF